MKKYELVAKSIKEDIISGKYVEGENLPTEEALTGMYSVSRQTIRQALSILVDEGFISKKQGSGSLVKRSQSSSNSRNIAVIATYIDDYIFPAQLGAAEEVFSANRYTPIIAATRNRFANERAILSEFLKKPIDGFLIEGTKSAMPNPNNDLYSVLLKRKIPVVFFNSSYPDLHGAVSVCADNYNGGYSLVKHLLSKGHTNIAGIFKSDDIQGHQRYSGYISALRDNNVLPPDEAVIWYTTESKINIFEDTAGLIKRLGDSTAVVCYNDDIALSLIKFLTTHGKNVPCDISVVSFDNSNLSEISPVRITSLSTGDRNIGRIAAQKLVDLIDGKHAESEAVHWSLVEKESS